MEEQKEKIHESGLPKPPANPLPHHYVHEWSIPVEQPVTPSEEVEVAETPIQEGATHE